jgi:hypothetical protein
MPLVEGLVLTVFLGLAKIAKRRQSEAERSRANKQGDADAR